MGWRVGPGCGESVPTGSMMNLNSARSMESQPWISTKRLGPLEKLDVMMLCIRCYKFELMSPILNTAILYFFPYYTPAQGGPGDPAQQLRALARLFGGVSGRVAQQKFRVQSRKNGWNGGFPQEHMGISGWLMLAKFSMMENGWGWEFHEIRQETWIPIH